MIIVINIFVENFSKFLPLEHSLKGWKMQIYPFIFEKIALRIYLFFQNKFQGISIQNMRGLLRCMHVCYTGDVLKSDTEVSFKGDPHLNDKVVTTE